MDPNIDSAPPLSVALLRLSIQHCIDLAKEAGLEQTCECLQIALATLGGPLPAGGGTRAS